MKTAQGFKLNSEITTIYSNLYVKENHSHSNSKNTDKAKEDAQSKDVIKIIKVADQRAKNYKNNFQNTHGLL